MITIKVFNYQTGEFQEVVLSPEQAECTIGRNTTCDLILESSDVSRVHAKIQAQQDQYYFLDPGSANGSRINGEAVEANQPYLLKIDDLIRIGDFVLSVEAIGTRREPSLILPHNASNASPAPADQWPKQVRCVRVTAETPDVKTFTFVAEPPVPFHYQPGQFVTLDLEIKGESVLRSYSISSTPSRPHTLEITVKRVAPSTPQTPPGLVSNWLHDSIQVGSLVKLSAPMGKFTCAPDVAPKLLMISAGSGITPLMSMSRWLADTAATTDVIFFHSARTPRDIIFRPELELLSARLPNFHLTLTTTQANSSSDVNSTEPRQAWSGFTGRLTETMLGCIAPDFQERQVYVCGPEGFMQATKTLLEGCGFPMENYAEESFGPPKKAAKKAQPAPPIPSSNAPQPAAPQPAAPALVLFSTSGKQVAHDGSESILELAEQEGIKIRSSCRQGVCGACKKRKLEGEVKYDSEPEALEPADQAAGYILTCVASPVGRVAIEA